jgi:hypothetical protein
MRLAGTSMLSSPLQVYRSVGDDLYQGRLLGQRPTTSATCSAEAFSGWIHGRFSTSKPAASYGGTRRRSAASSLCRRRPSRRGRCTAARERLCATGEAFVYAEMTRLMVRRLARAWGFPNSLSREVEGINVAWSQSL